MANKKYNSKMLSERENKEINSANSSNKQPVIFVHGLWLLAKTWNPWVEMLEQAGYTTISADWPNDPATVKDARKNPQVMASNSIVSIFSHLESIVKVLDKSPILVGHSTGGLLVQMLASKIGAKATVAISPAPFRGVLPVPLSTLRATFPVLSNPLNINRSILLTPDQFKYGFVNTVQENSILSLYEKHHVPAPGRPLFQVGLANLNPWSEAKVNAKSAKRGPLLIIAGGKDHTVPVSISKAAYKIQKRNSSITDFYTFSDAGHSMVFDHNWKKVAQKTLDFIKGQDKST